VTEALDQLAAYRKLKAENQKLSDENRSLKQDGGGGTLPPVDIIDAKIEAAEARTDTKFAMLTGDLTAHFGDLKADLARKPGTGTLIGIAVAIVALLLGALAYGGDRLALGVGLADQRQEQLKRDQAQDKKFDEILDRLPKPATTPDATSKS
jgi:hypothetical protein